VSERRRRECKVDIRCDWSELDAFEVAAGRSGVSLSAWARLTLRKAAGLPVPGDCLAPVGRTPGTCPTDEGDA
jgi:hypothetical protein